jgi:hypothetical protein
MADYIEVPFGWQVRISGGFLSHRWNWVLNVDSTGLALTQGIADSIATGLSTDINVRVGAFSTGWTADSCQVTDLSTENGPSFAGAFTTRTGTDAGQPLPPQTSLVVSWKTNSRGPAYRGRTYLNGFTESVNVSGRGPDATSLAAYVGLATDIKTRLGTTLPYPLTIVSRYSGVDSTGRPIPRPFGITTTVRSFTVKDAWRTQRRRAKQVL